GVIRANEAINARAGCFMGWGLLPSQEVTARSPFRYTAPPRPGRRPLPLLDLRSERLGERPGLEPRGRPLRLLPQRRPRAGGPPIPEVGRRAQRRGCRGLAAARQLQPRPEDLDYRGGRRALLDALANGPLPRLAREQRESLLHLSGLEVDPGAREEHLAAVAA